MRPVDGHLGPLFSGNVKPPRAFHPALSAVLPVALPLTLAATIATVPPAAAQESDGSSPVVINEVESNGDPDGDWVELANTDPNNSVDVSGWGIVDNDPEHDPILLPAGTEIESGGYLVIHTEPDFGLGGNDSVTLSDSDGTNVDETEWSGHASTSWGRVPDMTGDLTVTGEPTEGLRNVAEDDGDSDAPSSPTAEFPYDPLDVEDVTLTGDHAGDFAEEDMSGVDFGPDGTAYIVNNGTGSLYTLTPEGDNSYHIDSRHTLRYPDGSGELDAEGVTVGPDGAIFVATERDNSEGEDDTSRPSVLRFEPDGADGEERLATDEWNRSEFTGDIGAIGGLETISWIPGADPLFAVGVEETGDVLFVSLSDGDPVLQQRYESPFDGVMASDFDSVSGELTILCDEVCDGASQVLAADDSGEFAPVDDSIAARPAGLDNLANEGYARFVDEDGTERYLWADDVVTDGVGLRGAVSTGGVPGSDEPGSLVGSAVGGLIGSAAGGAVAHSAG